ncbi:hypothetical protein XU18_4989 [Perkinsela sp. CCAP 1560/4]|nr:hypothetical protein XU18_4989 [Perkinsela sp. CCAP 1560/4]|eukprot:KNH03649.1 hypothetical protein XU18_4989 [Perkinsela sp. CCAP 1560/4]
MSAKQFDELLLSDETLTGLSSAGFTSMTRIQRETLPITLEGQDVIACAKTGSGKTLAFLIPVLETLTRECWSDSEGLGALILTPTRELATQISQVLGSIGTELRNISAGIVTGGLGIADERRMIAAVSVIIATPGRFRQHLDESAELCVENLKVFVLDEADRLLDAGFSKELQAILGHITPSPDRQTLLFSATLTADIKVPEELGLRDAKYISVHDASPNATPQKLCQNFLVVPLEKKIDVLYSFILAHERHKMIVFASTCNQVKFYYLALSRMLLEKSIACACLTGKMKQNQRQEVYNTFAKKSSMVLFATDVACRGLDFQNVRWVVQFDCPDSIETYIHRAGRTARCGGKGCSLLMLTPEETDVLYFLHKAKLPLREVQARGEHLRDATSQLVTEVTKGLKMEAQKAFISYLRSIHLNEHHRFLTLDRIDFLGFARSLGLFAVPNLDALKLGTRPLKNVPWEVRNKKLAEAVHHPTSAVTHGKAELAGGEKMISKKNVSRSERHRSAKHLQDQYDLFKSFNPKEGDANDILEAVGTVSASASASNETGYEGISKKSKRLFQGSSGVDVSVSKLGLSKHTVFDE